MSSGPSGWFSLILTTLGAGATGAAISTYGTQTRERRQARAAAREALRNVEDLTPSPDTREQLAAALDALDTSAMLAGLPRKVMALHREARLRSCWYPDIPYPSDSPEADRYETTQRTSRRVAHQAAELLVHATWHPWATAPWRWYRARRLALLLAAGDPHHTGITRAIDREARKLDRDTIRQAGKRTWRPGSRG
jgi:hypothetical protein